MLKILAEASNKFLLQGIDAADVGPAAAALGVRGGIDAHALPFGDGSFDLVVSQFGLEYCGPAAWAEAVRVLAPGGRLLMVCHHAGSAAVQHNARRLGAMQAMAGAGVFALAEGLAAGRGEDAGLSAAVQAARSRHGDQSVVTELPGALGHWARAGRGDAVASIRAEAEAEMARLAAMQAAALDAEAVAVRVGWLAPVAVEVEGLEGPDGLIGWVMRGVKD